MNAGLKNSPLISVGFGKTCHLRASMFNTDFSPQLKIIENNIKLMIIVGSYTISRTN